MTIVYFPSQRVQTERHALAEHAFRAAKPSPARGPAVIKRNAPRGGHREQLGERSTVLRVCVPEPVPSALCRGDNARACYRSCT